MKSFTSNLNNQLIYIAFLILFFFNAANAQEINLALGKPASALVSFNGLTPSSAFDGNINTLWGSDATEPNPWLQLDLGSPQTIGRIEVVARQDGDQPATRCFFEIRGSNTPDFSTSVFLATPGALPFAAYGTWTGNTGTQQQFQYIRLVRTNQAGHINLSEMRVYSLPGLAATENKLSYPNGNNLFTSGNKMLVLKASGKAMDVTNASKSNSAGILQSSYNFGTSQQWIVKDMGAAKFSIINANSGLCVDVPNGNYTDGTQVAQFGSNAGVNQLWQFVLRPGGFYSIESPSNTKCLQVTNDAVVISTFSGADNQLWRITDTYVRNPAHSNTDWISAAKYGIMMHWLLGQSNNNLNLQFDVNYLANQLVEAGAKYLVIALGQNSGYYNSPNAVYNAYAGYQPGDRMSTRDLPMELADALIARGLKLLIYLPSQVANQDPKAQTGFGLPQGATDQPVNMEFAMKWAQVIQEWSDRYGDNVAGWWFDGGYSQINFTNDLFDVYSNAAKHGNHAALVTFNPGIILTPNARAEDMTAGETNAPFSLVPDARFMGTSQWHMMTYLGSNWMQRTPRNTAQEWMNWLTQVFAKQGAVDIDAGPNFDPAAAPVGSISIAMMDYFRQFKTAYRPALPVITGNPADQSVVEERIAHYSVTASGTVTEYHWLKNDVPIPNKIQSLVEVNATLKDNGTNYSCIVVNAGGSLQSAKANLTVTAATIAVVPGTIQAEDYNTGGEGIAYHDVDSLNNGGKYRFQGVDIESVNDIGGGCNVGWIANGEWLEYTISVSYTSTYNFEFRIAGLGGSLSCSIDGTAITGVLSVPNTGAYQTWSSFSAKAITLSQGLHKLRVNMINAGFNLNYIKITESTITSTGPATENKGNFVVSSPVEGVYSVKLNEAGSTGNGMVYDAMGKCILHQNSVENSAEMRFDLNDFPAGIYLFQINSNQVVTTYRILKSL